ncbi:MAG: GlsB/YeaQ/YmgE family stress response membrane protein [Acidimicrobiales bacterium]|nr:GlsB/YeaQ/YmgE family stress response membrane protein [Acidimicrobiales bacterium]
MIGFIVFGLVVGFLARAVVPGRQRLSLLTTLVLGLIGSVVGGIVANALGTGDVLELNFVGSVVAVCAAVVLIVIGDRAGALSRRGEDRRRR